MAGPRWLVRLAANTEMPCRDLPQLPWPPRGERLSSGRTRRAAPQCRGARSTTWALRVSELRTPGGCDTGRNKAPTSEAVRDDAYEFPSTRPPERRRGSVQESGRSDDGMGA